LSSEISNFTELAYVKDLSKINLEELKNILFRWQFDIIQISESFLDVKFCENVVSIEIRYTSSGDFVKILSEE
jgi:hypothetical protein